MFGEWIVADCLNQHGDVYVTKQVQVGKVDSYHNLNWK